MYFYIFIFYESKTVEDLCIHKNNAIMMEIWPNVNLDDELRALDATAARLKMARDKAARPQHAHKEVRRSVR